nr:GNAT family N-acetyltransferase [Roseateles oligotrophus]
MSEGAVLGTILVGHDGRRGLIHHLAVASESQRKGIGTSLVHEGLRRLRAVGIQKCHLLVYADNVCGRAFLERVGAEHRDALAIYSLLVK